MRGRLGPWRQRSVSLIIIRRSAPDALGQQTKTDELGAVVMGSVQPVTDEQATQMQLKSRAAALNAWLPPDTVLAPYDRVMYDGKRWHVRSVERWQSYLRVTLEELIS